VFFFCLTSLLLNLFLVIPVFASWKLFYACVGTSQNMHLGGERKKEAHFKDKQYHPVQISSEVLFRPGV
jgi:hypothetical protein